MKRLIGILLILIGLIYLGSNLGLFNINIFFDGWWALFIIVPSINCLFKKEYINFLLGTLIGVLLILAANDIINWSLVGQIFLPALLIIIGFNLIFTKKFSLTFGKGFTAIFSSVEEKVTECKDISTTAIFGGVDLDLRKLDLTKNITINCFTIFGGIDILLPDSVNVVVKGMPIFGGVENMYNGKGKHTITIEYGCIFAGISIK